MMGKHTAPEDVHYRFEAADSRDRYEAEVIADILRAMPLEADALGDGGESDWTLSILFALAGKGDSDALLYIAPRLEAAALMVLADLGYPGDAFQGV
jgi:hypothetical protein